MSKEKYERTDCFAYSRSGWCNALQMMDCQNCKFYKNGKQAVQEAIARGEDEKMMKHIFGRNWRERFGTKK